MANDFPLTAIERGQLLLEDLVKRAEDHLTHCDADKGMFCIGEPADATIDVMSRAEKSLLLRLAVAQIAGERKWLRDAVRQASQ